MCPTPQRYQEASESWIINLAKTGDVHAFEELVERRQTSVRNLMLRFCNNTTLSKDLSQLVFLKVWQKLNQLSEINAFDGWLKRIAINTWLQHIRKTDAMREYQELNDETRMFLKPEDGSIKFDLDRALSCLSNQVRTCVVLAYHEGMSHPEISKTLELPLGTVKSHIKRGGKKLKEILDDYRESSGEKVE